MISRTYHLDVGMPTTLETDEQVEEQAAEWGLPWLLDRRVVVPLTIDGVRVNEQATVRFSGTRPDLENLRKALDLAEDENVADVDDGAPSFTAALLAALARVVQDQTLNVSYTEANIASRVIATLVRHDAAFQAAVR